MDNEFKNSTFKNTKYVKNDDFSNANYITKHGVNLDLEKT